MNKPVRYRAHVEITDEMVYYQGFNEAAVVNRELSNLLANEIVKLKMPTLNVEHNPMRRTKTYTVDCYLLDRYELKNIIMHAVNRSHSGMPPIDF